VGTGAPFNGTGFLVNFRDLDQNIIMTAGHNIFREKRRVTSIKIFFSEVLKVPNNTITATGDQLIVSKEYESDPEDDIEDYGFIVFGNGKRDEKLGGMAFSALITDDSLKSIKQGNVAGYLNNKLERASGKFGPIRDKQLSYHIKTEQGISGGPVWVDYQRCDTVVGIQ